MRSAMYKQDSLITKYCLPAVVLLGLGVAPVSAGLFPESRITYGDNYYSPGRAKISGHIVIWGGWAYETEERKGRWANAADISDIGHPVFLYGVPTDVYAEDLDFEGNVLTWAHTDGQRICVYDLANPLAKDNWGASNELRGYQPVTNGSQVIYVGTGWQYPRGGNPIERWTIHIYVPHWAATTSLINEIHEPCRGADRPGPICIDGDTIVWSEYSTGKVWGLDVFERKSFAISYGEPRGISGNLVLIEKACHYWQETPGRTTDEMLYVDISDRNNPIELPITNGEFALYGGYNSRIDGNIIVWQDKRNGNWDIYGYDITSDTEFQITSDPAHQTYPDISGHTVVWTDYRHTPAEIYAANIAPVCLAPVQGDLNNDCKVDFADFVLLTQNWLECKLDPPSACWE